MKEWNSEDRLQEIRGFAVCSLFLFCAVCYVSDLLWLQSSFTIGLSALRYGQSLRAHECVCVCVCWVSLLSSAESDMSCGRRRLHVTNVGKDVMLGCTQRMHDGQSRWPQLRSRCVTSAAPIQPHPPKIFYFWNNSGKANSKAVLYFAIRLRDFLC